LEAGLGLSAALFDDIKSWGVAWNARHHADGQPGGEREAGRESLAADAVTLVDRMRGELKDGLRVELDLR
jgi:hypothetical protein